MGRSAEDDNRRQRDGIQRLFLNKIRTGHKEALRKPIKCLFNELSHPNLELRIVFTKVRQFDSPPVTDLKTYHVDTFSK
jgi:hypothetical protein